jgi:hypothetical protein
MIYSYKKWNNSNNNPTGTQTCIACTDFSIHICSLSFAVSVQYNIHIFFSLSYFFFLVASWCLSYSVDIFFFFLKVKIIICIDKSVVSLWLGKTWDIWHHKPNFVIYGDIGLYKPIELGLSWENQDRWDLYTMRTSNLAPSSEVLVSLH